MQPATVNAGPGRKLAPTWSLRTVFGVLHGYRLHPQSLHATPGREKPTGKLHFPGDALRIDSCLQGCV